MAYVLVGESHPPVPGLPANQAHRFPADLVNLPALNSSLNRENTSQLPLPVLSVHQHQNALPAEIRRGQKLSGAQLCSQLLYHLAHLFFTHPVPPLLYMGNYTTNYDLFQQKIMQYHHFLSKKRIDKQANLGQNKTVTIITIFCQLNASDWQMR